MKRKSERTDYFSSFQLFRNVYSMSNKIKTLNFKMKIFKCSLPPIEFMSNFNWSKCKIVIFRIFL